MSADIVLLLNLGSPSGDLSGFLGSLLSDPYVLELPWYLAPFRGLLLRHIVSQHLPRSQALYDQISHRPTLLATNQAQAQALSRRLDMPVYVVMRHSSPSLADIDLTGVERVIAVPLFPQYSRTTTGSSLAQLRESLPVDIRLEVVDSYADDELFVRAWVDVLLPHLSPPNPLERGNNCRVIFSAHSIPERNITKHKDPYLDQLQQTVDAIMRHFPETDYALTFQSQFGRGRWLQPTTEDYIRGLRDSTLVVVPVSFTADNLETYQELDIAMRQLAEQNNNQFIRVPAPNTSELFIEALARMVERLRSPDT